MSLQIAVANKCDNVQCCICAGGRGSARDPLVSQEEQAATKNLVL